MIPPPVRIAEGKPWEDVRENVEQHGTAVLYTRLDSWQWESRDESALRRLLGRDFARYVRFDNPILRRRFAAARALLKTAAAFVLRVPPESLELSYSPSGRPYLRGFDQLDMSLSHTEDLLLVGLTTRGLIGVDVERADRMLWGPGLGHQVCTPHELRQLSALAEHERNQSLVRLWTLKEAYTKAIGQGMQFRFTEFGFADAADAAGHVRVLRPDGTPGTGDEWAFSTQTLPEGFCMSTAVCNTGFGSPLDPAAATILDQGLVAALSAALGSGSVADTVAGTEQPAADRRRGPEE
ncbi:4'-phosphopantetheinyl transferase superfamily protein [Kitasatospora sp. NPDC004669]|uniref:4'-phosphopantetheinyl transferase family protein n=1 Tax=Kitasatospora sp. NPDC004669 TaxID=3154555 RepID=UPI0033A7A37D